MSSECERRTPPDQVILLAIADLSVELHVRAALAGAVRRRYGGFARSRYSGASPSRLRLFASEAAASTREVTDSVPRVDATLVDATHVALEGDCSGHLDLASWRGEIQGPDPLSALDTLLRMALSLFAPHSGWLMLHGAAVQLRNRKWALLLGRSGAGKSTAARAFPSFCDEFVLARTSAAGGEAASTPYWHGRPGRGECEMLVCLERSRAPAVRQLRGAEAVRALAPHEVRHVRLERSEEGALTRLCALARQVPVFEVCCPVGSEFVPFLTRKLGGLGYTPVPPSTACAGGE